MAARGKRSCFGRASVVVLGMAVFGGSFSLYPAWGAREPDVAALGEGSGAAVSQASQVALPHSKPIGYLVADKNGKVLCGKSLKGPISQGACDAKTDKLAMAKRHVAEVKATQTACGPGCAALAAAAVCALGGMAAEAALLSVKNGGGSTPGSQTMDVISKGSYATGVYKSLIAGAEIVKAAGLFTMEGGKAVATVAGSGLFAATTVGVCMFGSEAGRRIVLFLSRNKNDIQRAK